jgi:FkbM family methyltransferase
VTNTLTDREKAVYDWLCDDESRKLFLLRKRHTEQGLDSIYDVVDGTAQSRKVANMLRNNKYIIYGVGNAGKHLGKYVQKLGLAENCVGVWDNFAQGKTLFGKTVISPPQQRENICTHSEILQCDIIIVTPTLQKHFDEMLGVLPDNIKSKVFWLRPEMDMYFDEKIIIPRLVSDEVFIDGGCLDFETSEILLKKAPSVKKIYAFEPEKSSIDCIKQNVLKYGCNCVDIQEAAIWSSDTTLKFITNEQQLNKARSRLGDEGSVEIKARSVDSVAAAEDKVTFIKFDIEGAELEGLKGAAKTIKRDKPKLAICIYHKPNDYYEIAEYIKSLVPEYKAYIRHYYYLAAETILYCVI